MINKGQFWQDIIIKVLQCDNSCSFDPKFPTSCSIKFWCNIFLFSREISDKVRSKSTVSSQQLQGPLGRPGPPGRGKLAVIYTLMMHVIKIHVKLSKMCAFDLANLGFVNLHFLQSFVVSWFITRVIHRSHTLLLHALRNKIGVAQ